MWEIAAGIGIGMGLHALLSRLIERRNNRLFGRCPDCFERLRCDGCDWEG